MGYTNSYSKPPQKKHNTKRKPAFTRELSAQSKLNLGTDYYTYHSPDEPFIEQLVASVLNTWGGGWN